MKSAQHERAFNLFYQTEMTRKQIADLLNIDRKTLFTWIKEGNWMRSKNAARNTPTLLVEQYYNQLCELNLKIAEREDMPYPTKDEAEVIRKLTAVVSQYNKKKASIGETIEVLSDFHEYLDRNYNSEGKYIMSFSDKYVQHRVAVNDKLDYGKQYYENLLHDREYDQYVKEQAELKQEDLDNNNGGSNEPPADAEGGLPETHKPVPPPIPNRYDGLIVPIPETRKNFRPATPPPSTEPVTATNEAASRQNNEEPTTHVIGSPIEPPALNAGNTLPLQGARGYEMGNFNSVENPMKPATEATNTETKSTENGEFLISENGKKNPAALPSSQPQHSHPTPGIQANLTSNKKETRQEMALRLREEEIRRKQARAEKIDA